MKDRVNQSKGPYLPVYMYACRVETPTTHRAEIRKSLSWMPPTLTPRAHKAHVAPILSWMPPTSPTTHHCPTPFYATAKSPAEPSTTARPTGCAAVKSAAAASATATASPE